MNVFPANIMIVDDTPTNVAMVKRIFEKEGCSVAEAENGEAALAKAADEKFDLILLDVMMPIMDGFTTCERLKAEPKTRDIPVIFITAMSQVQEVKHGFDVGGVDYIVKPFNAAELHARVRTHLELRKYREQEIVQTQKDIIFTLAYVGELRSKDTGNHTKRVSEYSGLLGELYGLNRDTVEMLKMASAMHDIGKVAIPDSILNKPSALDEKERAAMNHHTHWGYHIFSRSNRPILRAAAVVAAQHHEKYDGTGYPKGLKGEEIHIFGRIVALADVFDALLTKRSYKDEWRVNKALGYITEERGKHFDPELVDLFVDNFGHFLEIRQKLKD
jgi:putative two-component system response regulator